LASGTTSAVTQNFVSNAIGGFAKNLLEGTMSQTAINVAGNIVYQSLLATVAIVASNTIGGDLGLGLGTILSLSIASNGNLTKTIIGTAIVVGAAEVAKKIGGLPGMAAGMLIPVAANFIMNALNGNSAISKEVDKDGHGSGVVQNKDSNGNVTSVTINCTSGSSITMSPDDYAKYSSGQADFLDLVDGKSSYDEVDSSTGITTRYYDDSSIKVTMPSSTYNQIMNVPNSSFGTIPDNSFGSNAYEWGPDATSNSNIDLSPLDDSDPTDPINQVPNDPKGYANLDATGYWGGDGNTYYGQNGIVRVDNTNGFLWKYNDITKGWNISGILVTNADQSVIYASYGNNYTDLHSGVNYQSNMVPTSNTNPSSSTNLFDSITNGASNLANGVSSTVANWFTSGVNSLSNAIKYIGNGFSALMNAVGITDPSTNAKINSDMSSFYTDSNGTLMVKPFGASEYVNSATYSMWADNYNPMSNNLTDVFTGTLDTSVFPTLGGKWDGYTYIGSTGQIERLNLQNMTVEMSFDGTNFSPVGTLSYDSVTKNLYANIGGTISNLTTGQTSITAATYNLFSATPLSSTSDINVGQSLYTADNQQWMCMKYDANAITFENLDTKDMCINNPNGTTIMTDASGQTTTPSTQDVTSGNIPVLKPDNPLKMVTIYGKMVNAVDNTVIDATTNTIKAGAAIFGGTITINNPTSADILGSTVTDSVLSGYNAVSGLSQLLTPASNTYILSDGTTGSFYQYSNKDVFTPSIPSGEIPVVYGQ